MRPRRVLAALLGVAGIVVGVLVQSSRGGALELTAVGVMYGAYLGIGLLILRTHPEHAVGRLMLAGGAVAGVSSGLLEACTVRLHERPDDLLALLGATVGSSGRGLGWLVVVLLLPLFFPHGHRDGPRRTARAAWVLAWVALTLFSVISVFAPTQTDVRIESLDNPVGVPHAWAGLIDLMAVPALLSGILTLLLAVVCLVWQWRHAASLDRQRLLWFALGFVLPIGVLAVSVTEVATPWMFALVSIPLPVAIGVACLQHRLYDLDLVLNRSLTYAALWLAIAGLYALTVGGVGAMMRQRGADWLPWVAAGVVAVSFAPLREALQRGANKLTYGQWSQPADVLSATGRRLSDATDVPGLLQALVEEMGEGLHLSYVEIRDAGGVRLALRGRPEVRTETLTLRAYGARVGDLQWSGRVLRESDRILIGDVAHQLGAAVYSAALLGSLRASQERLVLAREEERRRLRRDLHDGLGPALAGLTLQVDTLRHLFRTSPGGVDAALLDLRSGIQSTVLDVRRMVEGLRPAALDELGLAEALRQLVRRLEVPDGPTPTLAVDVDGRLPAAVEVAAYRIVAEAVTNVVKHAEAHRVTVHVSSPEDCLLVDVRDDGLGAAVPGAEGVGLVTMRERAVEIGGRLTIRSTPGAGTRVLAELPLNGGSPR